MQFHTEKFGFLDLTEAQTRQLVDADSAWRAMQEARHSTQEVRGSMMWRVQSGRSYLIRVSGKGAQTSLGIFQKVDKTFQLRADQKYTAVNASGFEIDIIRRSAQTSGGLNPHPVRVSDFEEDFWAVQVSSGQALLDGGHFSQTVVSSNGHMATMVAPSPGTFVRIKALLGKRTDRDPLKARKDLLQSAVVQELLDDHGLAHVARAQNNRGATK